MKQMRKWLICMALIATLTPVVALAGVLEAAPMQSAQTGEIPAIEPESTIVPTTWTMPKTFRATKGGTYQLVEVRPDDRSLPTIYAQSSKPDVVSVTDQGEISAKEIGQAVITIKKHNGKLAKCTVEVVRTTISRKKPAKGSPGEVVTSTKSMAYDDGKLKIEIYMFNRSGSTIKKASGLSLQFKHGESVVFEKALPTWKNKKGLKDGATKVYKVALTRSELASFTDDVLDLGSGEYEAVIVGWNGESGASSGTYAVESGTVAAATDNTVDADPAASMMIVPTEDADPN